MQKRKQKFRFPSFRLLILLTFLSLLSSCALAAAKSPQPPLMVNSGGGQSASPPALLTETHTQTYIPYIDKGGAYYVSTSGNDSNPGTAARPWKTLRKGVSALKAGSTLFIKSGTYPQSAPLIITASGSAAAGPIIISTAPGEPSPAVITGDTNGDSVADAPTSSVYDSLVELRGSYLHFQNLEVAYSKGRGILSSGSQNVISGSRVHHIWNTGIYVYGPDNIIEGNTLWRTADSNYCNGAPGRKCNGDWSAGIAWGEPHDATIPGKAPRTIVRGNQVFLTSGEGILCMHTDYGLVEGNVVHDNWAENIYLDQCSHTTIQQNLAYYTNDPIWWRFTHVPASGILLANEGITDSANKTYPAGHGQRILNNILVGNGVNIEYWKGYLADSGLANSLIANNTLVNPQGTGGIGLKIDEGMHSNTRVVNNLILQTDGTNADVNQNGGLIFGHNLWWSGPPPADADSATDVIANPLLVDPNHPLAAGLVRAEWYRLSSKSPAIGRGMVLPEVSVDYWNNPRGAKPDIGAHQYTP